MDNGWYIAGRYYFDPAVWPVVLLLMVFMLRTHIGGFIDRLSKATFPGGSVEAAPKQQQTPQPGIVREATTAIAPPSAAPTAATPMPPGPGEVARPTTDANGRLIWPSDQVPTEQRLETTANERNTWFGISLLGAVYISIFQSQFMALKALAITPLRQSQLITYHLNARQRGYVLPFDIWLDFLLTTKLIERNNDPDPTVTITLAGQTFLHFCNSWGLTPDRLSY